MNVPLLILGTRSFAEEIKDLADETPGVSVVGFVENLDRTRCQSTIDNLPVHWVDELSQWPDRHRAICALGTTQRVRYTQQVSRLGMRFHTLIHPTAHLSRKCSVATGCVVGVRVIVAAHTCLGDHVIVNRGAMIGHHTRIADHVTIGPGVNIAGNARVAPRTYLGMGAIIRDGVSIGSQVVVGAGSVVTKDVPDRVQVVGVPARVVKEEIEGL
ncbi:MAG: NeuD/PglB/VioB family sugar acetyltransferase [Pirellulaceae bacterium]